MKTRDLGPEQLRVVYSDRALITRLTPPSAHGAPVPISSSSQPSLMAQMLEDLKLGPGLTVLEIGAGTGYNAALLAHVVGPGLVTSVDVDADVLTEAQDHLLAFGDRGVELQHVDGRGGCPSRAPYDRIMVTAAAVDLEPAWLDQLADRGLLLAPVAFAPGLAYVVRGTVTDGVFHGRLTRAAYFMPLRAEGEAGLSELEPLPPGGDMHRLRAPWAGWFDRKRVRTSWVGFSQSLAFFGMLRGMNIHYRVLEAGQPAFGISQGESLCWFTSHEWHVNGDPGRDLGSTLWRAFLDSGGPWPTEFRLRASPGNTLPTGRRPTYYRQGPCCYQMWELLEPRDRAVWL
jgi:protein-L-isoaspartate(D-aspartate) O-methyltransferase